MTNLSTILSEGLVVPLRGYLSGLVLSTAGSSATFSVAAGMAVDDGQKEYMNLSSAISKTTSAWAVGSGNGGLDTGSVAINTWYHVFLIKRPDTGVVDVLFSLSASSPTMPTSYTLKRRIGSLKTNASSQWTAFSQVGDEFLWLAPVGDVATTTQGTTATLNTLSVPPSVQVIARVRGYMNNTVISSILITSPDETSALVNGVAGNSTSRNPVANQAHIFGDVDVRTNTSAQIRLVGDTASTTVYLATYGWIDTRGKLS